MYQRPESSDKWSMSALRFSVVLLRKAAYTDVRAWSTKRERKKMYTSYRTGFLLTVLKLKFNFSLIVGNIGLERKNNTVKISVITHNPPFCGRKAHTITLNILDVSGHFTSSRTAVASHTSGSSTLAGELV